MKKRKKSQQIHKKEEMNFYGVETTTAEASAVIAAVEVILSAGKHLFIQSNFVHCKNKINRYHIH
jgi:hypothetical protein